jgi:predicted PurR-regulated permease PerM
VTIPSNAVAAPAEPAPQEVASQPIPPEAVTPPASASTVALTITGLIVAVVALRMGAAFFIPLLLSLFMNYALTPAVSGMKRIGIPCVVGAAIAVLLTVAALGGVVYRVSSDAGVVLEQFPNALQRIRQNLVTAQQEHSGALDHVQRTAKELEKLADAAAPAPDVALVAAPVRVPSAPAPSAASSRPAEHSIDLRSAVLLGTSNVFIALGQILSALFLSFFLLSTGDLFRRKFVRVMGPSLARRKITVLILDDVNRLNQHYFMVVLLTNVCVGIATALAFYWIGMDSPMLWGITAAIMHTIPYVGTAAVAGAAAVTAYGQFGTVQAALLAGGLPLFAAGVLGIGLQTWLMGRAARMNAPAVFVSLLFWGMVWGGWGLLLAVPIMVAIKTVFDHIDQLKPYGEMLGP